MKTGCLLLNLGTPDSPSPAKVKDYLEEFLMDPDVIDIPFLFRWLLVKQIILRTRPKKSAEAYSKIWTERGSPLRFHSFDLRRKLQKKMGEDNIVIELGMRYGNPSMLEAIQNLKNQGVDNLIVFPLYPQFAAASVTSSLKLFEKIVKKLNWNVPVRVVEPFYKEHSFIGAWELKAKSVLGDFKPDHVLMSFHGLPERHVKATDFSKVHCLARPGCCDEIVISNKNCYRAQSFATARKLAERLGFKSSDYTVCFQSRLGRTPWIKPYTDLIFADLAKRGVKKVAVICPAFVADCLETLEEIGIRGREQFKLMGGGDLVLVPSLNSDECWVSAAQELIEKANGLA